MTIDLPYNLGRPIRFAGLRVLLAVISSCAICPAYAQVTETVLYNFTGGKDGSNPDARLLADTTGPAGALRGLYSTALQGGNSGANCFGTCGTVFRLTPPGHGHNAWRETTLWDFSGAGDGANPIGDGLFSPTRRISQRTTLYGTSTVGGDNENGTVFSLTGNVLTTIWTFSGGSDGGSPYYSDVLADKTGNLYTSAVAGGANGDGTVIELTPPVGGGNAWTETTIWTFSGATDGALPNGLIMDASGALYGTTEAGGATGNGTVFKLTPPAQGQSQWTEQTLWSFQGGSDGSFAVAPLTLGRRGEIYGTTLGGGTAGTAFRLVPPKPGKTAWKEEILWNFSGGADGGEPYAELILDRGGAVYGTTSAGHQIAGTVFKLTPPAKGQTAWGETTLWAFSGGSDGGSPYAGLTADKAGILYGTAGNGGTGMQCSGGCGVVFCLSGTGYVP
jgi:uncharacterized repeat protein (TIGR03803 family)